MRYDLARATILSHARFESLTRCTRARVNYPYGRLMPLLCGPAAVMSLPLESRLEPGRVSHDTPLPCGPAAGGTAAGVPA